MSACYKARGYKLVCALQEVNEMPKSMGPDALLKQKIKQKRHREGYEEGLSTMHKPLAAAAFVVADNPVELLASTACKQPQLCCIVGDVFLLSC